MVSTSSEYQPKIGLEIHAQLLTASKLFCRCSTQFGASPNSQVCPICLGLPGTLPILNRTAVDFAIRLALATHCQIAQRSLFVRKNYFYPDLPKGYQISQYDAPLGRNGYIEFETHGTLSRIGIARIHLEEDAGKLIHEEPWVPEQQSLVDFNRCGVPLIEIVTNPEIHSAQEAVDCFSALRQLVRYLGISDGSLEQGSMRCDANISIVRNGLEPLGAKTEIKNLNSMHSLKQALEFEITRQTALFEQGGSLAGETLLWDVRTRRCVAMRRKEASHDYRYFPEPDLVPLSIDQVKIEEMQQQLPELPLARRDRFMEHYHLDRSRATRLTGEKLLADYFEQVVQRVPDPVLVSRWMLEIVWPEIRHAATMLDVPIASESLAELLNLLLDGTVNDLSARDIFRRMLVTGQSPQAIIHDQDLTQVIDRDHLIEIISAVIHSSPDLVAQFRAGKTKLWGFFMGQVMERTQHRADPHLVSQLLREQLEKQ